MGQPVNEITMHIQLINKSQIKSMDFKYSILS